MTLSTQAQLPEIEIESNTRRVAVGDLSFPVFDQGTGEVVLLIHGFPDSRHLWRYQIPALLNAGFRVVAPDLKGYGEAPKPEKIEDYALTILKDEVVGIMDSLEIDKFYLAGHDWGAVIAWLIASMHPDRIKKLVALSVGIPGNRGSRSFEQLKAAWYGFLIAHSAGAENLIQQNDWEFFRKLTQGDGDQERYIRDLSRPGALSAALNYYRANFKADFNNLAQIPAVQCDVMGIWSDGDIYLVEDHLRTSKEHVLGNWRYEKITGASHWFMLEKPEEVNRLLLDFLKD